MNPAPASNVDTLTAALAYLARGWSIVPLVPKTKRPAVKIAPFLSGAERMTEADARAYWRANPDAGVAIVTGAPSGLVVCDCDPRNGGSNEETRRDCPSELVAQTGGGGLHVFVRHPGGTVPCGKTSRLGVDRKGDGGYVVAAPSIHPDTGEPYRWLNAGEPGELPAWALEKQLTQANDDTSSEPWIADALANPQGCVPGEQETVLARLAWWAARHLPYDIALGVLCGWARQLPLGRPHDPWTVDHIREKLDRAYQKRALEPGAAGPLVNDTTTQDATRAERIARLVEKCESAKEWAATGHETVPWAIDRLLAFGTLTDLHSPPKEGKSTFLAHVVRALVNGSEVIGRAAQRTPVVWVTEQPRASFETEVLQAAGLRDHPAVFLLYFHDLLEAPWDERAEAAIAAAKKHEARVIIFDTFPELAGIEGDDENKSGAMLKALKALTPALADGLAVMIVRHDRKNGGGGAVAGGRGSTAIPGKADALFQLTMAGGQCGPNVRRLIYRGRLGAIPSDLLIELTANGYEVLGARSEVAAQRYRAEQLAEWLHLASVAPPRRTDRVSGTELARRLDGQLGENKALAHLVKYRAAVGDGMEPEAGMLCFAGTQGKERYWRACACRVVPELDATGAIDALRVVPDAACDRDHGNATASQPQGSVDTVAFSPGEPQGGATMEKKKATSQTKEAREERVERTPRTPRNRGVRGVVAFRPKQPARAPKRTARS